MFLILYLHILYGRLEFGSNIETDLANEYCTNLNDDFLELFDGPIQQTQKYDVRDHHEAWQKAFGTGLQVCTPCTCKKLYLRHNGFSYKLKHMLNVSGCKS